MPRAFEDLLGRQQELFKELAAAHDAEVSKLRDEIALYRSKLTQDSSDGVARNSATRCDTIETFKGFNDRENDEFPGRTFDRQISPLSVGSCQTDSSQTFNRQISPLSVDSCQTFDRQITPPADDDAAPCKFKSCESLFSEHTCVAAESTDLEGNAFREEGGDVFPDLPGVMASMSITSLASEPGPAPLPSDTVGSPMAIRKQVKAVECHRCKVPYKDGSDYCHLCGLQRPHVYVHCQNCGNRFRDDSVFCRKCGVKRVDENTENGCVHRVSLSYDTMSYKHNHNDRRISLTVPARSTLKNGREVKDDTTGVRRLTSGLEKDDGKDPLDEIRRNLLSSFADRDKDSRKRDARHDSIDSVTSFREPSKSASIISITRSRRESHLSLGSRNSRRSCHSLGSRRSEVSAAGGANWRLSTAMTQMAHLPLEVWPLWQDIAAIHDELDSSSSGSGETEQGTTEDTVVRRKSKNGDRNASTLSLVTHVQSKRRWRAIHPTSLPHLCWITCGVLLIWLDLVRVPMGGFDIDFAHGYISDVLAWIASIFWTIDTGMSFFVAYSSHGDLEIDLFKTSWRYFTHWFFLDLMMVLIDWVVVGCNVSGSASDDVIRGISMGKFLRTIRALRAFRVLRLVRVTKLPPMMRELSLALGRSDVTSLSIGIAKSMSWILLINHLIACSWYFLGKESSGGWVSVYMASEDDWKFLYLTSLHWSLTQFTPATMAVQPQNLQERAFAVAVLLFALVTFSSFVSSITNLMTHLRSLRGIQAKQEAKLEAYLGENHISLSLSSKVRRFVEFQVRESTRNNGQSEKDVELLGKLSDTLRREIHFEVHSPWLLKHAFFQYYQEQNLPGMQKLCHTAVQTVSLLQEDIMFNSGEMAKSMFVVQNGTLEYKRPRTAKREERIDQVFPGHYLAENVLWSPWEHRGSALALTPISAIGLQAEVFQDLVMKFKTVQYEVSNYAIEVVRTINEAIEPLDFTDFVLPYSTYNPEVICERVFETNVGTASKSGPKNFLSDLLGVVHNKRHSVSSALPPEPRRDSTIKRVSQTSEGKSTTSVVPDGGSQKPQNGSGHVLTA